MALLEITTAFKEKRAQKLRVVKQRKSLARIMGEVLGVLSVRLSSYVLPVLGLGSLTAAAWLVALPLGLVALGVSLLILDYGRGS